MAISPDLLKDIIGMGGQVGSTLLGHSLSNQTSNKQLAENARQFDTSQAEKQYEFDVADQQRQLKNRMLGAAMPGLLTNLGMTSNQVPGLAQSVMAMHQPTRQAPTAPPAGAGGGGGASGLLGGLATGASILLPFLLKGQGGVGGAWSDRIKTGVPFLGGGNSELGIG